MKIIGVTGGIGAGKSSVSAILKKLGVKVIDADQLSREVVEVNKPAYKKIVEEFGVSILNSNKSIDRKKLAAIVFNEPEKRHKLEKIVHSEVIRAIMDEVDYLKRTNFDGIIALDVPIPVKHGFLDLADRVWVVTAPEKTRIKRVQLRSGLSEDEVLERISSQISQQDYINLADNIIDNGGSLEELEKQVTNLLAQFKNEQ